MRYVWIALGFTLLHRLIGFGLALLGFGVAMSAFGGSGASASSGTGLAIIGLAALWDFPVVLLHVSLDYFVYHRPPSDGFAIYGLSGLLPGWLSFLWSLCVGTTVAFLLARRHRRRYGVQPPTFWKKGL